MRKPLTAALLALALLSACGPAEPLAPTGRPSTPAEADGLTTSEPRTPSATLRKVRGRDRLKCGVSPSRPGFATQDAAGAWTGFDIDICRAVAAATLGDASKVDFVPLQVRDRFAAVQQGVVDLAARDTAWTFARDAALGVEFAGISFYDAQGFLAPRRSRLTAPDGLADKRICVTAGSNQLSLADYFRGQGLTYTPVPAETEDRAAALFASGDCEILSGVESALAAARLTLPRPDDFVVLPGQIAKYPLGPMVREGDDGWVGIVRWTLNSLILGEELGLTSKTAAATAKTATDPEIRRLLGVEGGYGRLLGLKDDWAYQAITQVGTYDEIFGRNLGAASTLKLARGDNALWTAKAPGLLYSPPMR